MNAAVRTSGRAGGHRLSRVVVVVLAATVATLGLGWAGVGRQVSGPVVRSGWPLTWVAQDRSALSPPPGVPAPGHLLGPWENPTRVDGARLVVDVALTGSGLLGAAGAATVLRRRRSRRPQVCPASRPG